MVNHSPLVALQQRTFPFSAACSTPRANRPQRRPLDYPNSHGDVMATADATGAKVGHSQGLHLSPQVVQLLPLCDRGAAAAVALVEVVLSDPAAQQLFEIPSSSDAARCDLPDVRHSSTACAR